MTNQTTLASVATSPAPLRARIRFAPLGMFRAPDMQRHAKRGRETIALDDAEANATLRSIDSAPCVWRDECDSYRHSEWQGRDEGFAPIVARIGNARRAADGTREGAFIAGYRELECGYVVLDVARVFWAEVNDSSPDTSEVAHAAHAMARRAAEREAEYQEGWQCGREAADALNQAADERSQAIAKSALHRAAMRERIAYARSAARASWLGHLAPHVWRDAMREARAERDARRVILESGREDWRDAMRAAEDAAPLSLSRLRVILHSQDYGCQLVAGFASGFWESVNCLGGSR